MKKVLNLLAAAGMAVSMAAPANAAVAAKRISVTGEIIDTWCYVTEIMFAQGTAHHQCAVWCAVGGIPVSIKAKDGTVYMVLRIEGDDTSVANPKIITIQSHKVSVTGDHYVRDGVNYLIVNKVADDKGIVNLTHDEYGIVPFGE
jgi:type 1 fimbria pilin